MKSKDPNFQREAAKYDKPIASREYILNLLEQKGFPMSLAQIIKALGYREEEQKIAIKRRLRAMENSGQLVFTKFKQYAIATEKQIITGQVIGHRDGFGFLKPDTGDKDLFIPFYEMRNLIHGDVVEARVTASDDAKGRQEIKVLDVLVPRKEKIIGRIFVENSVITVVPEDARICHEIIIPSDKRLGARHGNMVIIELVQRPSKRSTALGKVVEVLGEHMAPGMEVQVAIHSHDIPHSWPQALLEEIDNLDSEVDEAAKQGRVDLRDLPLVTIDGEDARDFDDAVYCQSKPSGGWRLWVAIADVSYYVRPGTALDEEAIKRGNSVYFPNQVVPMLPEVLSNGLCSLNPDVDRLCMVCEMTVSANGKLTGSKFYPALMRSHARFTYTKVAAILDGDKELRQQYAEQVSDLEQLHAMYHALVHARRNRGAIEFETEEVRFIYNANRKIDSVEPVVRNDAHKIIEECMILANVSTAKFIEKHQKPGLFRVHDKPNSEKYNNLVSYLAELGIELAKKEEPEPQDFGEIAGRIAERPDKELIQTMMLRSMKQAVYQAENIGHFGLALPQYAHFTSPIRRYPDLVVHRVIKAVLEQQQTDSVNAGYHTYDEQQVTELGEHCSMTERRADEATREVADWLKCEFMRDHVGDTFTGVIATVTNFGFFTRLQDFHIEGLVHISSLGKDFYSHDEVRMCLVGEKTKQTYHVGDIVSVQVAAVNLEEKKIDLILAGDNAVLERAGKNLRKKTKNANKKAAKKAEQGPDVWSRGSAKTNQDDKPAKKSKSKSKASRRNKAKPRPGKNARKRTKS
ncbi:ribonuclease R [Thalassotalea sp. HSM 43]|uniref:ribonuclease R n=1 Tax=Thalassotalea sp. HSM 43 TaxID=2552945 RepID=UPI0010816F2D|nr:ribonuclease R [Thalassotalea sp. HSM 43]QBY04755.1 ribonuclease R [Thalassotalea sp. HSM 43]